MCVFISKNWDFVKRRRSFESRINIMLQFFTNLYNKWFSSVEMDPKTVNSQMIMTFGPKPEGFDEFLKQFKRVDLFPTPNGVQEVSYGYVICDGLILHQVMMQPFFQRDTLNARENDVVIVGFPKTGTSWMQEICYTVCSNGDLTKAKSRPLTRRTTYLESPPGGMKTIENNREKQRFFKSHLPYEYLHKSFRENKTKIIYTARNPKDTFVSTYFYCKNLVLVSLTMSMKEFLDIYLNEQTLYGSFANNVLSYWNRRDEENICFITYEELKKDSKAGIKKVSEFLGQKLTEEELDRIVEHTCFQQMADNPMTNYTSDLYAYRKGVKFMRKGKVGDWKNYFDDEMNRKMDDYIKRRFEGTGLEFEYENP